MFEFHYIGYAQENIFGPGSQREGPFVDELPRTATGKIQRVKLRA